MLNFKTILLYLAVSSVNGSLILKCQFSIRNLWHIGNLYTCQSEVANDGNEISAKTIKSVSGTHSEGKANSDVQCFYINEQKITYFPTNVNVFFPNLLALDVSISNLQSITAEALKPFPNLLAFSSWINNMESIAGDLFKYTRKLRYIAMYDSGVRVVGKGLLDGLNDLTRADFRMNSCINRESETRIQVERVSQDLELSCVPSVEPSECQSECFVHIEALLNQGTNQTQAISRLNSLYNSQEKTIQTLLNDIKGLKMQNLDQAEFISQIMTKIYQQDDKIATLEQKMDKLYVEIELK